MKEVARFLHGINGIQIAPLLLLLLTKTERYRMALLQKKSMPTLCRDSPILRPPNYQDDDKIESISIDSNGSKSEPTKKTPKLGSAAADPILW
jgi:hypothetical protein